MKKISVPFWWIKSLAVFYIVIWSISPPMEVDTIYRLLALGCAAIFFLMITAENFKFEKIYIYACLFALAVVLIAYIEKQDFSHVLRQIPFFILVICFLMNRTYEGRWWQLRWLVPIVLVLLALYNFNTVKVLIQDPTIARRLVRADESVYIYLRQGVGGYSLIYPQVCIFPAILAWIMKALKHNVIYFGIGAVWMVSYISYLLKAGYSIAIFASAAGAIILLFHKGKNAMGSFLIAATIFVSVLLLIIYVEPLREFLIELFKGTAVERKINDLMTTTETGAAEGSLQSRMIRYTHSLIVIFQYPFIGALWLDGGGGHSALPDAFAKYGIWGGYMYAKMLYYVPNYYKQRVKNKFICSISNGTLVSLLFVSILDAFPYSFMGMILIVLPLLYEDIIRWEGIVYENFKSSQSNTDRISRKTS